MASTSGLPPPTPVPQQKSATTQTELVVIDSTPRQATLTPTQANATTTAEVLFTPPPPPTAAADNILPTADHADAAQPEIQNETQGQAALVPAIEPSQVTGNNSADGDYESEDDDQVAPFTMPRRKRVKRKLNVRRVNPRFNDPLSIKKLDLASVVAKKAIRPIPQLPELQGLDLATASATATASADCRPKTRDTMV